MSFAYIFSNWEMQKNLAMVYTFSLFPPLMPTQKALGSWLNCDINKVGVSDIQNFLDMTSMFMCSKLLLLQHGLLK